MSNERYGMTCHEHHSNSPKSTIDEERAVCDVLSHTVKSVAAESNYRPCKGMNDGLDDDHPTNPAMKQVERVVTDLEEWNQWIVPGHKNKKGEAVPDSEIPAPSTKRGPSLVRLCVEIEH